MISSKNYLSDFKNELLMFNIIFKIKIIILNNSNKVINIIDNGKIKNISDFSKNKLSDNDIILKYDSNKLDNKYINIYSVYKIKI